MRKYIELKIDGTTVDLPNDAISVQVNYRIQDNLKPSGTASERSVSLPYSKTNKSVLGELGDFKDCYLTADGIPVLIGKAQFKDLGLKGGAYELDGIAAKVALYGNNADWITQLSDKKLSELDWSSEEHTLDDTTVRNGYTNSYPLSNYGYCVMRLKDWSIYGTGANARSAVTAVDSTPLIFIRTLLDKIFNELGYTYSSTFFDTVAGKTLCMPTLLPNKYPQEFCDEYLNGFWERTTSRNYTAAGLGVTGGLDFDTHTAPPKAPDPFQDSVLIGAPYAGNAGTYDIKISGYYKFTFSITVANFVGFTNMQLGFIVVSAANGALGGIADSLVVDGDTIRGSYVVYADIGDTLWTTILVVGGDISPADTFDITAATVEVYCDQSQLTYGAPIDFKYLLHDWTCKDFLKGLTQCFNLVFDTDAANQVVTIEPKDDYLYQDPSQFGVPAGALGINSGYLQGIQNPLFDFSKQHRDKFDDVGIETGFLYKNDSNDSTLNAVEENGDFKLYEARYDRSSESKFIKDREDRTNDFFAPTLHLFDTDIKHDDSIITPCIPLLSAANYLEDPTSTEKVETYEPRILIFTGERQDIYVYYWEDSSSTLKKQRIPECFMVNYNDPDGADFSLAFNNLTANGYDKNGLLQRFYLNDMARSRKSVERETWAYFSALDILNLDFSKLVQMDSKQYLLQEVKGYNPLTISSTKIKMILDVAQDAVDVTNIQSNPIDGFLANDAEE